MTNGSFGYKIGRKLRLMRVCSDADLLWQILVREIYVLMKHYGSIELLRQAFENLIDAKNKPNASVIEKCKIFTDLTESEKRHDDWFCLTRHCQHSFINILETGYFLNNGADNGMVFLLDFNKNTAKFYNKDLEKNITDNYETATIEEIMEFEDMPTKSLTEIVNEMRERYDMFREDLEKSEKHILKIEDLIKKTKELGNEQNIISRARDMLDDAKLYKIRIQSKYRFFYHRLDALNLIDHTCG